MSKLTWIHLSDLHFGKNEVDTFEQRHILTQLGRDISAQIEQHDLHIDYIFFTGDIAFKGDEKAYVFATEFLSSLAVSANIPKENILMVPGNHDIRRSSMLSELSPPKSSKEISELIGDKAQLSMFTSAYKEFREFACQLGGYDRYKNDNLFYVVNQKVNEKSVSILALNTAWFAGKDIRLGDAVLGERQVREALQEVGDADIIIALMHHPFSWLSEADNSITKGLLEKRTDFILNGHIHRVSDVGTLSLFGNAFNISSGSIYGDDSKFSNAYNIVECDFNKGVGTIFFRQYINLHEGYWSRDNSVDSSIPDGIATFALPTRIPIDNPKAQDRIIPTLQTQAIELEKIKKQVLPRFPSSLPDEIRRGNCVLFAGAGTSIDAGLPTWYELLKNMIDEIDTRTVLEDEIKAELNHLLSEGRNLIVAEYCRECLGEHAFGDFIHNSLRTKNRRSVIHQILSEIPFSAVLTTNYDDFIEKYRSNSRVVLPTELSEMGYSGIKRIAEDKTPIVKLHGSFDNPKSVIFSDSDYRKALYSSPNYRAAVNELLRDKSCLFVGFSLLDSNILAFLQSILERDQTHARMHYTIGYNVGKVVQHYNKSCLNVETICLSDYSQLSSLLREISERQNS